MSDARADAWIAQLRAELPFPQPLFGTAEPPAHDSEFRERLEALQAEVAAGVARAAAAGDGDGDEPDWFLALADRLLPLASWYAGVGLASGAPELPDRLRDLFEPGRTPPEVLEMQRVMTMVGRSYSLRGGTREILRGIIARQLGLR